MRYLNLLPLAVFLVFLYWQFNDPDGWLWALAYGYAAILAGLAATRKFYSLLPLIGLLSYGIWMFTLEPVFNSNWIENEESREFLGLVLCSLQMLSYSLQLKRNRKIKSN